MEKNIILNKECLLGLKDLPDNSIDCCITSPPYWQLRDYGTGEWIGGDVNCKHIDKSKIPSGSGKQLKNRGSYEFHYLDVCKQCGAKRIDNQIGLEHNFRDFIDKLLAVFMEVHRVLKPTGTLFVNLGDTYMNNSSYSSLGRQGFEQKDSMMYKEDSIVKQKSLCMIPERFAISMIDSGWILRNQIIWHKPNQMPSSVTDRFTVDFEKIFFFVKEHVGYYFEQQFEDYVSDMENRKTMGIGKFYKSGKTDDRKVNVNENGRNMRTVWSINTKPLSEAHFATYPELLVSRMVKAGCPENGIVLDPFMGACTTAVVSKKLNRNYIGFELNKEYIDIAEKRLFNEFGMFL